MTYFENKVLVGCLAHHFDTPGNALVKYMGMQKSFAAKYLCVSLVLCTLIGLSRNLFELCASRLKKLYEQLPQWTFYVFGVLLIAVIAAFHLVGIHDDYFWFDERFTIDLIKQPVATVIEGTSNDVHPPLYYLILKLFCEIFGYSTEVYRAVSLIPIFLVMIMGITSIRKRFGLLTGVFVILAAGTFYHSLEYGAEVRMYSIGLLFMTGSFILFGELLEDETERRTRLLFVGTTLAAAYTHYYCLIGVAFLYLVLLITSIGKKQKLIQWAIMAGLCILGYLPWLLVLFRTLGRVSGGYWIQGTPSLYESTKYAFSSKYEEEFAVLFVILVVYTFCDHIRKKQFRDLILFAGGIAVYFGTYGLAFAVTYLMRPVLLLRYLFPAAVILWIMFGMMVSRIPLKHLIITLLIPVMLIAGLRQLSSFGSFLVQEEIRMDHLEEFLKDSDKDIPILIVGDANFEDMQFFFSGYHYDNYGVGEIGTYQLRDETKYYVFVEDVSRQQVMEEYRSLGRELKLLKEECGIGPGSFSLFLLESGK